MAGYFDAITLPRTFKPSLPPTPAKGASGDAHRSAAPPEAKPPAGSPPRPALLGHSAHGVTGDGLPGDVLKQAVEFVGFRQLGELADDGEPDRAAAIDDREMAVSREDADLRSRMAKSVGEELVLRLDTRGLALDDLLAESQHGLAARHDGDLSCGDTLIQFLHT
ncbi:MAG: hypothetical protein EBR83_00665 [Verrucomicrobia bacterium]|nr:hypothetical protein [Verrucomicrobiota bacterium]